MTFKLNVKMNNQAFIDDNNELCRILKDLANRLEACDWTPMSGQSGIVRDINGNTVGNFTVYQERTFEDG